MTPQAHLPLRVLVFDFSGHPFQAELSRALAARGHDVVHGSCGAYVSGKGNLGTDDDATNDAGGTGGALRFRVIGRRVRIAKSAFFRRFFQEVWLGLELLLLVARVRPQVVLVSTTPVPMAFLLACFLRIRRTPWVLWHQDIQGHAVRAFARESKPLYFRILAWGYARTERWTARRARQIVVIADSFLPVHREWGTLDRVTVIPNWAPLGEIRPGPRDNPWSQEQGLSSELTLLYSGTLGLKHQPALLPRLARAVMDRGVDVRLVVVNEGPARAVLEEESARCGVALTLLPFQPYERLSEVLSSGDLLVVLLEDGAGSFSVPSKTLSYLAAGRPIVGFMPADNLAAELVTTAGGCVVPPHRDSLAEAADWAADVLRDHQGRSDLGKRARELAESEFDLTTCASTFEDTLHTAITG
ncbi:glycosyltransferase family 4 protein [Nocardioides salsibiostraticola]